MSFRKWLGVKVIFFVGIVAAAGWGVTIWYNDYQMKAKHDAAHKAEELATRSAIIEQAKANLTRLRNAWNADETWERTIGGQGNKAPIYSLEIEHALVKGSPIIVIGHIQDVGTSGDQGVPMVTIENREDKDHPLLKLSLVTTPAIANAILAATHNDRMAEWKTFISAVSIKYVEKIKQPPNNEGDDEDYFLAHGTLFETYDTQLDFISLKDLGVN